MKIRRILVVLLAMTALFLSFGSVSAYMRKQTSVVSNVFEPAKVSCVVEEKFLKNNQKTEIKIQNTSNIEAYLRLTLVTYWVDANNEIVFKASKALNVNYDQGNWIKSGDIYYYKYPVAVGALTPNLLNSAIQLEQGSDGTRQVVEVFAEAIQSKPTNAVTASWKVTITENADGVYVITKVN